VLLKSGSVAWAERKKGGRHEHVYMEAGEGGEGGLAWWSVA
jgi:hypothetical protein